MRKRSLLATTFGMFVCATFALVSNACAVQNGSQAQPESESLKKPDFKIVTEIFSGNISEPVSSNQTMFQNELVFDFLVPARGETPCKITIYDSRNRKFVLLDVERQVKLNLDSLQVLRVFNGMKKDLESNERTKHLANAEYDERFDVNKMELVVENRFVKYRVSGERPKDDSILPRYHDFLDQYTFLSATDPRRPPPFARVHLNRAIKKYGLMQKEVELSVSENGFQTGTLRATTASSKHSLTMTLNESDLMLIATAKRNWTQFKEVNLPEYRQIEEVAANAK